jgi:hypothetical protein
MTATLQKRGLDVACFAASRLTMAWPAARSVAPTGFSKVVSVTTTGMALNP